MVRRSIVERDAPSFDAAAADKSRSQETAPSYIAQKCFRCEATEDFAVLIPCRNKGQSLWVCTHCLPTLIHG